MSNIFNGLVYLIAKEGQFGKMTVGRKMAYGCFIAEVDQKKHFLFKHNDACVFFAHSDKNTRI